MDGAGIMNLPTEVGGSNTQNGLDSFAPLIAAQQTARDMGYPRFTRELLAAGSEMDQAEVQEFLQTIRDAGLTSEDVALMRRVVEAVFNDPNNYPEVRQTLLQEGIPEDLLPETFDLEFFTALRMAVEEAENLSREPRPTEQEMPMPMEGAPVEMADGGIVGLPQLKPVARAMASMGRQGDTMLAHITPQEAMMLKRMGGSGSINPYTGLPEFFLGKIVKGIGKAIKGVAKGIKKFAKSTVGRIVLSVALGAFLGPMAAGFLGGVGPAAQFALSAGIGTFGSSLLAGDGFKNSLRNGLTAGALSYAGAGVFGEAGFSGTPAAGAPTTFAQGLEQGIANIKAPFQAAADFIRGGPEAAANVPTPGVGPVSSAQELVTQQPSTSLPQNLEIGYGDIPADSFNQPLYTQSNLAPPSGPIQPRLVGPHTVVDGQLVMQPAPGLPSPDSINIPADLGQGLPSPSNSMLDRFTQGAKDIYSEYISPTRAGIQGRSADTVFDELVAKGLPKTADTMKLATDMAAKEAPGFLTKYGPLAAIGATTAAATGGLDSFMKTPEGTPAKTTEEMVAESQRIGSDFLRANPQFTGGFARPEYYSRPTYMAAQGSGPQGVENFPRKNGHISGPGTGTSDDIPAMLSDGEFVFTAQAVRNMGNGSRRKGAAKMYKLMKMLEGGPVGKTAKA